VAPPVLMNLTADRTCRSEEGHENGYRQAHSNEVNMNLLI
jgi:hypothetical protein